jgi:hypothetical protein
MAYFPVKPFHTKRDIVEVMPTSDLNAAVSDHPFNKIGDL